MAKRAASSFLRDTTPVSNLCNSPDELQEMMDIANTAYQTAPKNIVEWVKSHLGPQTRTFTGEFRYYLWEFQDYTIWVANGKGIIVEVIPTLTPDAAMAAYREAFKKLV